MEILVSVLHKQIIDLHQSVLVYLGDHLVYKQREQYGYLKMVMIIIVDYLKVMQRQPLEEQLRLQSKLIQ